ncbi:MAG: hypothetical protein AABZ53_05330 [Planctomycetota bacterium]|mgnify:CR=1 FL=1
MANTSRLVGALKWTATALAVLAAAAWVTSASFDVSWKWGRARAGLLPGSVQIQTYPKGIGPDYPWNIEVRPALDFIPTQWSFFWERGAPTVISIPFWMPLLGFGLLSGGLWIRQIRAARRKSASSQIICAICGYDCAGIAPGAVCPECGASAITRNLPNLGQRRRRAAGVVIALLMSGSVESILIAWGIALFRPAASVDGVIDLGAIPTSVGGSGVPMYAWRASGVGSQADTISSQAPPSFTPRVRSLPGWDSIVFPMSGVDNSQTVRRGWPFLCMWYHSDLVTKPDGSYREYLTGCFNWRRSDGDDSRFPTRTIWPGFAYNTAFYAALTAGAWFGGLAIRRKLRPRPTAAT